MPENLAPLRAWVGDQLLAWLPDTPPGVVDDLRLIASELVTNAVRARGVWVTVHLEARADVIVVGVEDDAPGTPRRRQAAMTDVCGRGLAIVEMLAQEWGVRLIEGGKVVWASVDRA